MTTTFSIACFITAVKYCICITIIFQFFHLIFNTSWAGVSLTVLCDVDQYSYDIFIVFLKTVEIF